MAKYQNQKQPAGALDVEDDAGVASGGSRCRSADLWPSSQPLIAGTGAFSDKRLCLNSSIPAIMLWLLKVPAPIFILFALLL